MTESFSAFGVSFAPANLSFSRTRAARPARNLEIVVQLNPSMWEGWAFLANEYQRFHDEHPPERASYLARALEASRKGYQLAPHEPVAAMCLAAALLTDEQYEEGLDVIEPMKMDPRTREFLGRFLEEIRTKYAEDPAASEAAARIEWMLSPDPPEEP